MLFRSLADLLENEHFIARGDKITWADEDSGREVTGVAPVPKFQDNPGRMWRGAPATGQDTEAVLKTLLGYTPEQIDAARMARAI